MSRSRKNKNKLAGYPRTPLHRYWSLECIVCRGPTHCVPYPLTMHCSRYKHSSILNHVDEHMHARHARFVEQWEVRKVEEMLNTVRLCNGCCLGNPRRRREHEALVEYDLKHFKSAKTALRKG